MTHSLKSPTINPLWLLSVFQKDIAYVCHPFSSTPSLFPLHIYLEAPFYAQCVLPLDLFGAWYTFSMCVVRKSRNDSQHATSSQPFCLPNLKKKKNRLGNLEQYGTSQCTWETERESETLQWIVELPESAATDLIRGKCPAHALQLSTNHLFFFMDRLAILQSTSSRSTPLITNSLNSYSDSCIVGNR